MVQSGGALTFSARCLEKPICRRVSRGLRLARCILVGVGFFLGGRAAISTLQPAQAPQLSAPAPVACMVGW